MSRHDTNKTSEQQDTAATTTNASYAPSIMHSTAQLLTKEEMQTMARVRKDIWVNGMKGLFFGSVFGYAVHAISRGIYSKQKGPIATMKRFNKNTVFLSVMLGGAFGSYICSTVTGKNNVHFLHDILYYGNDNNSNNDNEQTGTGILPATQRDKEHLEREERRIQRRKTVRQQLEEGHGLSDSHGGNWIDEEAIIKEQMNRQRDRNN